MTKFPGFARPKSNFYRLPNDWFDIWRQARESLAQGSQPARMVGPIKIVEYVIKYTWGRTNFDEPIRMSRSDLRKGVRGRQNRRLDKGTGLGSEATISRGISTAIELGLLEQVEINDDPGRQERLYLPRLRPPEDETSLSASPSNIGFERPTANFFLVPNYWSDISAEIRSEILIMAMEYFFRHSWGWQTGPQEIRWMDADDVANGRKYRSDSRRGDRYDKGTGYSARKIRDALEEGVRRELLIWRKGQAGKEYALRMAWMNTVGEDGYLDLDDSDGNSDLRDQTVEGKDQSVEVRDQTVGPIDQTVGGWDQSVEAKDQVVGGTDQNVEGKDQVVEVRDQTVDRTYKDTVKDTKNKILLPNTKKTTTARHRKVNAAAAPSKKEKTIIFRPELTNGELGNPKYLTFRQATDLILAQNGALYWSESDLADPDRADDLGFTLPELRLQAEFDNFMLSDDSAILDDGRQLRILSLLDAARVVKSLQTHHPPPVIYHSLWQFLDLPEPEATFGDAPSQRRALFLHLQEQTEAWGDPDLITALEQTNISADEAQSLVNRYGAGVVGAWLRSLRANSGNVRSLAAVLISQLNKGLSPPGGEMKIAIGSPIYDRRDQLPRYLNAGFAHIPENNQDKEEYTEKTPI